MRSATILALAMFVLVAAWPAASQQTPQPEVPVLLSADEVSFDREAGVVTAKGNVEISQANRVLLADTVIYNQRTKIMRAIGNVSLTEPTGEILFADTVELSDDLRDGVVENFRMLFTDDSRFAANEARRIGGVRTEMDRAVYLPCKLCKDEEDPTPLWRIRARKIVHDQESHDVVYRDARYCSDRTGHCRRRGPDSAPHRFRCPLRRAV